MAKSKPTCPNGHPSESVTAVQALPRWHCLACLGEGKDHDLGPAEHPAQAILDNIDEERKRLFFETKSTRKKKRRYAKE